MGTIMSETDRLLSIIREYQAMTGKYAHESSTLRAERDRAREIAAMLEAECAACWGPIHFQTLHGLRHGS